MNLWDKKWRNLLMISSTVFAFFSCSDQSEIGLELNEGSISTNIEVVTLPLSTTQIKYDSLRTSGDNILLLGKASSDVFGSGQANAIVNFFTSDTITSINGDSIRVHNRSFLNLRVRTIYADETSINQEQEISISKLSESISNASNLYYLSSFSVDKSKTYTPSSTFSIDTITYNTYAESLRSSNSTSIDTFMISIPVNSLGKEIFDIFNENERSEVSSKLAETFNGLIIEPTDNNSILMEVLVDGLSNIEILYDIVPPSGNPTADILTLPLAGGRFSQTSIDHSGSIFNEATNLNEIDPDSDFNYLSSGFGIYPVIDFTSVIDHFNQLEAEGDFVLINRAEIHMPFETNSEYIDVPDGLELYYQLQNGQIDGANILFNTGDNQVPANRIIPLVQNENEYAGEMSTFIQLIENNSINSDGVFKNNKLTVMPADPISFREAKFDKDRIQLKVWYTITN